MINCKFVINRLYNNQGIAIHYHSCAVIAAQSAMLGYFPHFYADMRGIFSTEINVSSKIGVPTTLKAKQSTIQN